MALVEINTPFKLLTFVMVFVIMVLGIFVFLSSIIYCYTLQKFYIKGQPLLNTPEGRTLYAAVISMMICLAAAACTNNRSVHSVTFIFLFAISGIVALGQIKKIKHHAQLYFLDVNGTLQTNGHTLGKIGLTQTFSGITIAAVIVGLLVWLLGMMIAFSFIDSSRVEQIFVKQASYF